MISEQFKSGLKDSIPFGIGFVFLYLAIGMQGFSNGVPFSQLFVVTAGIFSTPLQFLLVQNIHSTFLVLVPIILAMNARFLLMSAVLLPYFKQTEISKITFSTVLIVPSVYTGCMVRFRKNFLNAFGYFLGLAMPIYLISIICVTFGFFMGAQLRSPILSSILEIVLPLQFTALAAKHWPEYIPVMCYWVGFLLAPFLVYIFKDYNLLLAPFVVGALALAFDEIKHRWGHGFKS